MSLPSEDALRRIVTTYARLRAAHGAAIGAPDLVQPNGHFFPDEFRGDVESVGRFLRRMVSYAPVSDATPIELVVLPHEASGGGCGSLACETSGAGAARGVEATDEGYRILLPALDAGHADVLGATLARAVGAIVLSEAGEDVDDETSELAAAACGFGVLLANGAAVWAKGCGGLRMAKATVLPVDEIATALALFVAVHQQKAGAARAHFGATQRDAFDAAWDWVDSNGALVAALRETPEILAGGLFEVQPVRGLFGRWFARRSPPPAVPGRAPVSADRQRRLDEARALVDEVLAEGER
ncbi:MAG TPA: hypothetical protein VKU41_32690 [Polyangiaceae bacterium]|nr:hypothetical protein [Polyangiaceae bacterium]